jgi:hypothetical protein
MCTITRNAIYGSSHQNHYNQNSEETHRIRPPGMAGQDDYTFFFSILICRRGTYPGAATLIVIGLRGGLTRGNERRTPRIFFWEILQDHPKETADTVIPDVDTTTILKREDLKNKNRNNR